MANGEKIILMDRTYVLSKRVHNIFGLPQNMFTSSLHMVCERGFPLLARYSLVISRMNDAGIIEKLYADFRYNATYLEHIRTHWQTAEDSAIVLKLRHMDGAFAILVVGSVISLFGFFVEVCFDVHRRRDRARQRWQLIRNVWIVEKTKTRAIRNRRKRHRVFHIRKAPGYMSNSNSVTSDRSGVIPRGKYEFRYFE